MTSKRSGSKAKSGGGAKTGKRRNKKESFKDLEAKDSQKIRGGGDISFTKTTDQTSPK